jgi:uncharacterized protein (DUF433 family)
VARAAEPSALTADFSVAIPSREANGDAEERYQGNQHQSSRPRLVVPLFVGRNRIRIDLNGHAAHRLVERHRQAFRVRHPFAIKKFETDGKSIFHRFTVNGTEHVQDRKLYQLVIPQVFAGMVKRLDFDSVTDEALRYWPLGRRRHVTIEPSRAFGEAVVGGGVPTRVIYKAVTRSGDSKERVARWYSVTVADVDAAVEYEMSISRSPRRAA